MFIITGGKGFHIKFENGYRISVQFGLGNYCENKDLSVDFNDDFFGQERDAAASGSNTAEIAVMNRAGDFVGQELGILEGDDVEGWCTPARVLEVMNIISKLEKDNG